MDASDAAVSDGVMIAFLPTSAEWCKQELPHMTLVYAGTKDKLQPSDFNSMAKDAAMIAMLFAPFAMSVIHVEEFGDEEKVDVLRFRLTPELMAIRRVVERWNASEHPFRPHSTIGPATGLPYPYVPGVVGFNRIMVAWGEENLTFKL